MTQSYNLRDAEFIKTDALPSAAGTGNGTALDMGNATTQNGARLEAAELLLTAPALSALQLPSAVTATYSIESAVDSAFTSPKTLAGSAIVHTGDGNAVASSTFRMKLPSDCHRYVRAKVVTLTNAGNCAAASMTFELLF